MIAARSSSSLLSGSRTLMASASFGIGPCMGAAAEHCTRPHLRVSTGLVGCLRLHGLPHENGGVGALDCLNEVAGGIIPIQA